MIASFFPVLWAFPCVTITPNYRLPRTKPVLPMCTNKTVGVGTCSLVSHGAGAPMATEGGAGSLSAIALNARPRPASYGHQPTTQTLHKPPLFQLLLVQCVLSPFTSHYGCIRTVVPLPMTTMSVRNERLPLDYATAQVITI
jgi:hypothetical protein